MSYDVYTRHSVCYLNDAWKKGTVHSLLYFGYKMFIKAYRVANFEAIKKDIQEAEEKDPLRVVDHTFLEEILLDSIKISICFENYLKAELLLHGYVIHIINTKEISTEVKKLRAKQDKTPIEIAEVTAIQGYVYDPILQMNNLLTISDKTLNYSALLEKKNYLDVENIPTDILYTLRGYNNMRNMLHLLGSHADRYDQSLVQHIQKLIDFVDVNIKTKSNAFAVERGMTNMLIP